VAVRFADYVVSYSLQLNNRCLRYLAECEDAGGSGVDEPAETDTQTVFAENLLARDGRRLVSLWSLMWPAVRAHKDFMAHVECLQQAVANLAEMPAPRRLALRIAAMGGDETAASVLVKLGRALPATTAPSWDELNALFADDSRCWRCPDAFNDLDDAGLANRIGRSYRKAYRSEHDMQAAHKEQLVQARKSTESKQAEFTDRGKIEWLNKRGTRFLKWVQLADHHLELLRPGLSERGKAQLWYLGKLAGTLRTRQALLTLADGLPDAKLSVADNQTALAAIDVQIVKMDNRVRRLTEGCFARKPKALQAVVAEAMREDLSANVPT